MIAKSPQQALTNMRPRNLALARNLAISIIFAVPMFVTTDTAFAYDQSLTLEANNKYKTYSVLDIGKKNVPRLTKNQTRWVNRIHCTTAYAKIWPHLRFAIVVNYAVTPLTVYDERDVLLDLPSGAHVIGAPCDYVFDPFRAGTVALPPDTICQALQSPPVSKNCNIYKPNQRSHNKS